MTNKFDTLLERIISRTRIKEEHNGVIVRFYVHSSEGIMVAYKYKIEDKWIEEDTNIYISELIEQQILES